MNTTMDFALTPLCLYREARGEGNSGMVAVACVLRNRVRKHGTSYYHEVTQRLQFSSISAPGDPELALWPDIETDQSWKAAAAIAIAVINGAQPDTTGGATLYFNPAAIEPGKTICLPCGTIRFPNTWNPAKVQFSEQIGKHFFFREVA